MDTRPESPLTRGYHARREHRLPDAKEAFAEAVALYKKSNNPRLLAQSLAGLGQIERDLREVSAALQHYEEAVALYRTVNDPLSLAHTVRHIGDILRESGQLPEAKPHYQEALEIYCEQEDTPPLDLANAIRGFALLNGELGNSDEALQLWQEARKLYDAVQVEAGVAESDRRIEELTAQAAK